MTPEEKNRLFMLIGNHPTGSKLEAARDFGIDLTLLIEVALANLAVADDFPEWLLSQRASVSRDLDIEF